MASFNSTVIARVAAALYDLQLGNETMDWALEQVNATPGGVNAVVQSLVASDFAGQSHAQIATKIVQNVGITGSLAPIAQQAVVDALAAYGAGNEGAAIVAVLNSFASMTSHPVAEVAAAASAFNTQIMAAVRYADTSNTTDVPVHPTRFPVVITAETAAGGDVMRLTGNQDIRIDFTNPANQVVGLDLDYDGVVEFDGKERSITGRAADFEIVDAYARNPLNHLDSANNFLGDIDFDGEGFEGDGVSTNGNIVLGGLGTDRILGGDGNDFLAGGGIAQGRTGNDTLYGARNADFFFAQFAGIDLTDGNATLRIDGGTSADDSAAGTHTGQDADWLLFESSDDEEPVVISLNEDAGVPFDTPLEVASRTGEAMHVEDVENFDASGNLYGFLNDIDVQLGDRGIDDRDADAATVGYNYAYGSSAQLHITGSAVNNIIIGGYDNDRIDGGAGSDLLMGGNLNFLNNPNLSKIVNNGRDELTGGAGDDHIVFEADGGSIAGDAGSDTLWLTREALGKGTAASLTTDGVLRFDLKSENIDTANGYGGADFGTKDLTLNDTQDQTNYKAGATRVTTTGMESVIATGLGRVDYVAAGTNAPELTFTNQQNHFRYDGSLDLRGTEGSVGTLDVTINGVLQAGVANNTLYASAGSDVLEGRTGDDRLSGGDGNDDFYFATSDGGSAMGDHVDVIHRQTDANADNLWDGYDHSKGTGGLYERDFNIGGTSTTGASVLKIAVQKAGGNTAGTQLNQVVNFVSEIVTGVKEGATFSAITLNTAAIKAATTYQGLTDAINAALDATAFGADLQATLQSDGFTIHIADSKGRELADSSSEVPGAGVSVNQIANTATQNTFEYGAPAVAVTKDRLIYKAYEDRADNEGVDDEASNGSIISLGIDSYAEDLVINFADEDGDGAATTRLAEDQAYALKFLNVTTQDKVSLDVNGVKYALQVGVDLDGNIVGFEDQIGDTQPDIQAAFLHRFAAFINSFMDDDTSAGKIAATVTASGASGLVTSQVRDLNGDGDTLDAGERGDVVGGVVQNGAMPDTITITQTAYNGEETVFMVRPVVTLQNLSGGEAAAITVTNVSQHEVELLDFDGRNGELNETNVLFWGQEAISRAELSTAKNAGDTLTGTEAFVVDVGADNLQATVFGTSTAIINNTATNAPLASIANGWSVHGDDFLIGGNGLDTINGGTGDDRVEGSIGGNGTSTWDTLDGGKNFYAVQVLGESQARVYVLNKWEAANPTQVTALQGLVISSITLIDQNESGTGVSSGVFDDTLQFSQKLFTPGVTRFTVTLDNFTLTGGVVELRNDGAGTVGVDTDGNGTIDNWTRFTNFENVRTVSGVGNAVAGDGQGNDTLNVAAMSSATTGANGVLYNLTNDTIALGGNVGANMAPGEVRVSTNAHESLTRPAQSHFDDAQSLVIKVDGVESVIGGTGDDLLVIDETEAAKNNTFTGDLGDDRIEYLNNYNAGANEPLAQPTVTIKVDTVAASLGGTDTVTMTAGRVGTTIATDTLNGVEFITLNSFTAAGSRENDVLDVTALATGAIVNFTNGTIRASDNTLHLTVEGVEEIENVWGAGGSDTVIVGDVDVMGTNQRSDTATDALANTLDADLQLATFVDFDTLVNPGVTNTRKAFASQTTLEIEGAVNQKQFTFDLNKSGTASDTDTVDYSATNDNIAVVVELDATKPNQFVLVDGDGATFFDATGDLEEAGDRVDQLVSVERIVASQGESVLDLSASTKGLEIKWSAFDVANQVASLDRDVYSVRISDLSTASPLQRTFLEYRDAGLSATTTQAKATWSRVEGSDNAEVLILNSAHSTDNNTFNLRGGANQVKYNELTRSITTTLSVVDFSVAAPLGTVATGYAPSLYGNTNPAAATQQNGTVMAITQFQDGNSAALAGGGTHVVTSYTANNGIATGSLRIAASQDAEDTLELSGDASKLFLLSEAGTVDNQITVKLGSGSALNSVILTGYERLSDAASNDVYDFGSLTNSAVALDLIDNGADDHDTVKVDATAIGFNGAAANEISLAAINTSVALAPAGFDFDVLDVTKVNSNTLTTLTGTAGATDEVVIGAINNITSALLFEAVVLTQATVTENGTTYVLNTTGNSVTAGAKSIALTDGANTLSFSGTVLEQPGAPTFLRAATDLNATSGVTVTVVGNENVNITGGNGADTITGNGGNDVLRGGSGNDTLNGGVTAAQAPVLTVTINGVGTTSGTAGGNGTLTVAGVTLTTAVAPATELEISENADADQIGAAFAAVSLATWRTALDAAGLDTAEANTLTAVAYNATSNALTFTFSTASGAQTITAADLTGANTPAAGGDATLSSSEAATGFVGQVESQDRYVFEATAALNGVDTINNFNNTSVALTDDTLDFRAFLGAASNVGGAADFAAGLDLTGAANVGVVFNKATLTAADVQLAAAAGKIALEDNGKAVVLVTADTDGVAGGLDTTNNAYSVYYIEDTNAGAGQTYVVTLVGTINSSTELNAADLVDGTDAFV